VPDSTVSGSAKRRASRFYKGEEKTIPYRAISLLDEEPAYPTVLVVPGPEADDGPPLQGVS